MEAGAPGSVVDGGDKNEGCQTAWTRGMRHMLQASGRWSDVREVAVRPRVPPELLGQLGERARVLPLLSRAGAGAGGGLFLGRGLPPGGRHHRPGRLALAAFTTRIEETAKLVPSVLGFLSSLARRLRAPARAIRTTRMTGAETSVR
jgi:hypothetical protein